MLKKKKNCFNKYEAKLEVELGIPDSLLSALTSRESVATACGRAASLRCKCKRTCLEVLDVCT